MAKYEIETIRHSCAHVMAQALMRLFPQEKIQLGIGPTIENGFYYDIDMKKRLDENDLLKVEEEMKKIISEKLPVKRKTLSRSEALEFFEKTNQNLKVELIKDLPENEEISCYEQGEFVDLCRGPHVENTGHIPLHFKLLHTAGAYWRGDSDKAMLQRLYAVGFDTANKLKEHLLFLEEAKKRDHRKLGKDLELFIFDPMAPASPFFMPKGAYVYNALVDFMRRVYRKYNYKEVITPQILDVDLWHTSGHYANYKENMFFTKVDNREYAVKPMNCPCHMLMYKHFKWSYRDLPLRFADFGRIHRYEKSGAIAGLTRVRTFCQDDAHIFISMEGVKEEIKTLMEMFFTCYKHFKFENIKVSLSTRPEKKVGDDKTWDIAESALKDALESSGRPFQVNEGDGAFYGPKIDIQISDAIGRYHQLGTIQLDFQLPDRFDLKFTNTKGELERPVVIHRALLGSLERFFGVYLEHVAGAYPFWLAPVQAIIVPINNEKHLSFSQDLQKQLLKLGLRVELDGRNESMGLKTREAQTQKIPFMLAVGDREMESLSVSVRKYGEMKSETMTIENLKTLFFDLEKEKMPEELRD